MKKLVVVLTGGIASGKTRVSDKMAEMGSAVIDADQVAREVVVKNTPGWQAVRQRFGDNILDDKGDIDRRALRQIVFNDAEALADLNAITHPLIRSSIQSAVKAADNSLVIVVIPLLSKANNQAYFDRVLVIDVSEEIQHQRLQERDQISQRLAQKMVASQISRHQRLHLADDVISNHGGLNTLMQSVELMYGFYRHLAD